MVKYKTALLSLLVCVVSLAQAQVKSKAEHVLFTSSENKTNVGTNEQGELEVNVSLKDAERFKANGSVRYSDFAAKGDGKTDDIDAIAATHAFANQQNLPVKADDGFTYFISGKNRTAAIQTNTDFGKAVFMIDDTDVKNRDGQVFVVGSVKQPFQLKGIATLKKNQTKIDVAMPGTCLITVTDTSVKRYIRFGPNVNNGSSQTDIFMVDKNGKVDRNAPIIWDFDQITDITALPIDETILTISGGRFTTIANRETSAYNYYSRGISIRRSNVLLTGLEHYVTGEGDHGAPYNGFINIRDCANVRIQNTLLTGHKTYQTIGRAGVTVSMGTYDITPSRALNVSFVNCRQTNDINDNKYWGIMGSNFCKNIIYDSCTFSRFDAHQGVANATIRNSTLGHQGINAIGSGNFIVENTTVHSRNFFNLRPDYGSTWQGALMIRDCVFVPNAANSSGGSVISGSNTGLHNFGYTCYMPEKITIQNLRIDDSKQPADYKGPTIFSNFNPKMTDDTYREQFPYMKTKEVTLQNVTTTSGKKLRLSDNMYIFKDVKLKNK